METTLYTQEGLKAGSIKVPETVFGLSWNADLVNQVINSLRSDTREAIANTKTRGEVRGGGKKPWQQKGLGRSRHGSTRSPIWRHGGITHGPRADKNFARKVNKKVKSKALFTILSQKMRDGEILFIKDISLAEAKTKEAKKVVLSLGTIAGFEGIATKRKNAAYIGLDKKNESVRKSFNNFNNMTVEELRNINPLSLMQYKYVVITNPEESLKVFTK
jgi:large subunit ribosomal protein L4